MKTKETNPTRPGSPTPCKQGLSSRGRKPVRRLDWAVGSVSNDDVDANENGEKPICLDWQNNSSRAARFFVHFFTVTARLRREDGNTSQRLCFSFSEIR